MYFTAMLETREELLGYFRNPELVHHPAHPEVSTFAFLRQWPETPFGIDLPRLRIAIHRVDYLRQSERKEGEHRHPLRFQQDRYRLWYQIEGTGILQNLSHSAFGRATPGLLGLMDLGQRHSYLHQRGAFQALLIDFTLEPSQRSSCYWNSEIEGKRVLSESERLRFENHAFTMFRGVSNGEDPWGLDACSHLTALLAVVFEKGLLLIEDERFPRDKRRSMVAVARKYMDMHYADMHHQRNLSKHCGVDINYLNILFKKEVGCTLYRYLTTVRMEHAKHLLEEGSVAVTDVASEVGYPNSNSFSRAFKRHTGLSPSDYVNRHRAHTRPRSRNSQIDTTAAQQ